MRHSISATKHTENEQTKIRRVDAAGMRCKQTFLHEVSITERYRRDVATSAGLRLWRPWCTQKNEAPVGEGSGVLPRENSEI